MTYTAYLKWGTGAGLIGGVISSEYYAGKASLIKKELKNQTQKDSIAIFLSEALSPSNLTKSNLCLYGGPLAGLSTGASLYKIHRFVNHPAHALTLLIAATAVSAFSAYNIGNRD